ncbi:ABC transporter permease [Chitinophaga horti]|uniref:ABC transporter permease n=1 Tax=Chitinophaga horti TaxID=2920382 RepID=A0ABY6J824_9BACT|nr:ABC transporter permease [Chitinophaga horti]UYQ95788.1 ABC transporter permease [Chitinophaga horti]
MITSYLKTSIRNILRNKLFSAINIIGLAISMSVGLLLIALVLDLRSYDRFHANSDRIFRISNVMTSGNGQSGKFATSSVKAATLIREKVAGIEQVAIIRNNFSGDAKVGDHTLPVSGLWAEPSLFKIFSFQMIEGDPATALKDPYSLVLTQTAAVKLFGRQAAVGKAVSIDTNVYQVTGIMKDVPFFSHLRFEALVSLSSVVRGDNEAWTNMWAHSVYVMPDKHADMNAIRSQLGELAREENLADRNMKIELTMQPLRHIVVGERLRQSEGGPGFTGPHMPPVVLWILSGLAFLVILSACFNYTNLSIARATRRIKEIGLRKTIGAGTRQVRMQFLVEAVLISLAALLLSFLLFLVLRPMLINIAPEMQRTVRLELSVTTVIAFLLFSIIIGVLAGFAPALFFSKVSPMHAFGRFSTAKVFKHLTLRRTLIVIQYTVTLIFITTTAIGYVQYKNILAFDLGFNTKNILNINMQHHQPDAMMKELSEIPEITALSRSLITTGVGNAWGGQMKYKDWRDSALVLTNHVDENYLPLHDYKLIAGSNFIGRPATASAVREVIVNEQVLKRFNISANAIGEQVTLNGRKLTIVGVMQDFHYGKVDNIIGPVAYTSWTPEDRAIISAKIASTNMPATMAKIQSAWKKTDPVHPLTAEFYNEEIEEAYSEFAAMIRIIGFLSFLAITIASMGLFGMVVFTTETRVKEIGIRKVMGASMGSLVYLLSRGFLVLLSVSAMIALPVTYVFFRMMVLPNFPYHTPVQATELLAGLLTVVLIAVVMIGSQTWKAAGSNPVVVLKRD